VYTNANEYKAPDSLDIILMQLLSVHCMLHRNETWPMKTENALAIHLAEKKIIEWIRNRLTCNELSERLRTDDIITVVSEIG